MNKQRNPFSSFWNGVLFVVGLGTIAFTLLLAWFWVGAFLALLWADLGFGPALIRGMALTAVLFGIYILLLVAANRTAGTLAQMLKQPPSPPADPGQGEDNDKDD